MRASSQVTWDEILHKITGQGCTDVVVSSRALNDAKAKKLGEALAVNRSVTSVDASCNVIRAGGVEV